MREALTGVPLDTKDKQLEITVPDDYKDESLRGRKANLSVTILEVRAKEVRRSTTSSPRTPARPTPSTACARRCARDLETARRRHGPGGPRERAARA